MQTCSSKMCSCGLDYAVEQSQGGGTKILLFSYYLIFLQRSFLHDKSIQDIADKKLAIRLDSLVNELLMSLLVII